MRTIYSIELLKEVAIEIDNWNYEPIKGVALFTKAERYAHIEISIYTTDHYTDTIVWNVKDKFIPVEFHKEVEDVLMFFANYLTALKGRREKNLVFEIIDGSFNRDSGRHAFMYATVWALVNCFNKKMFEISPMQFERINSSKKDA